jgi:effector-binding domain-containing protein
MLDKPQIVQTTTQQTAVIPLTIPKADIRAVMGPGISELMATVAAQGITPVGPWFTHHLKIVPDIWDFEISVPIMTPVVATGRVKPSQWSSMKVVRTIYRGPYEGVGTAWGEFINWIAANGHSTTDELWESYVAGPDTISDPADFRTELTKRLIK